MPGQKDPNEIGALWSRSGAKGEYLTGEVNGVRVVCFLVNAKSDKAPTWRVLKATPREGAGPTASRPAASAAAPSIDEEIPF